MTDQTKIFLRRVPRNVLMTVLILLISPVVAPVALSVWMWTDEWANAERKAEGRRLQAEYAAGRAELRHEALAKLTRDEKAALGVEE